MDGEETGSISQESWGNYLVYLSMWPMLTPRMETQCSRQAPI